MIYDQIIANTIALEILDSGITIPSLPDSAHEILAMTQQPVHRIDIGPLESLIQKDPVLFAQLINLANSPFYRTTVEVTGLRTAIMRIGLIDTINTLNHYLLKKSLPPFPKMEGFSDKAFWEESWACAIANRRLGDPRLTVESLPGELYITGLLSGIGRLILAVYSPTQFNQCLEMARKTRRPLDEMELKVFKTTDALVARHLLEAWHIPKKVCAAVEHWKNPENSDPEHREIAALTQFACAIVRISGVVETCEGIQYGPHSPCLEDLSDTYLLKHQSSPIVNINKQYHIVQEIVSILEKQFLPDVATRKESPAPHNAHNQRERKKGIQRSATPKTRKKPKKKGWLAWIKSLFN